MPRLETQRFYQVQLRQLTHWTDEQTIPFAKFGKRHMDQYLAERRKTVSETTLRHDAICAKSFFRWCARNQILDRSPLAEYTVRNAPRPPMHMPSEDEMRQLLSALLDYWNPEVNPNVRYLPPFKRLFHRTRNYAIILLLIDSACRIGEVLSLKMDDYGQGHLSLSIRQSKGREPRVLPMTKDISGAIAAWLRIRERVMKDADSDEGCLFISEFGTKIDEGKFLKSLKAYVRLAKLPEAITLHSIRRYSLNKLAKHNLLAAQAIAGHKDTKTTLLYTKLDPDFVREMHEEVGLVRGILQNRREAAKRKRLV